MGRNPKILIISQFCQLNLGDALILNCTLKLLKEIVEGADFTVLSYNPTIDAKRCDVRVLGAVGRSLKDLPRTLSLLTRTLLWAILGRRLNCNFLVNDYILQRYVNADVIIVRGGDTLTEDNGFLSLASHLISILFAVLMQKPIILLGHTIGPFGMLKFFAKNILNKVDIIILREELSIEQLRLSAIFKPLIYVTADLAFLSDFPNVKTIEKMLLDEGINRNSKMIGISASQTVPKFLKYNKRLKLKEETYVEMMARMIDYLVDNFDVDILLIPSVLGPGKKNDDRIISKAIYSKTDHQDRVKLIVNEYGPEELKGIIGFCRMFIGARMHACIAAILNCVPTITLAYGHKFDGVIDGMLGQGKYVLNVKNLNWEILMSKINEAWSAKGEIRKDLQIKNRDAHKKARQNLILLRNFLKSKLEQS